MERRDWIIELTEELRNETEVFPDDPERWKKTCIYKIPEHAVSLNRDAYAPWVAAIGPYHHDCRHLQRMEEHKRRALCHFLRRSERPLQCYVEALAEVDHDLMDAYEHLDEAWKQDTKKFLQLMIIDGCFILETMRADDESINDYSPYDIIFSDHGKHNGIPSIRRDMLLLENQVPLLVLERLLAVAQSGTIENSGKHLIDLILKFYGRSRAARPLHKCQHILEVFRESMLWDVRKDKHAPMRGLPIDEGTVPSATEMKEAGIKFQKGSKSLKDIAFKGRTLMLPTISLDDTSESTFLNMLAYEQLHVGEHNEISTYIYFMNGLVRNERDVHLLKSCGIISNSIGSDKDVARLFLMLTRGILLDSGTWQGEVYVDIMEKLGNHFNDPWYSWRYHLVHFIHTYFRSRWAILSVVAASLGLGLSITQVIYAVLSFIHRNN